jgi:hypothetical protein
LGFQNEDPKGKRIEKETSVISNIMHVLMPRKPTLTTFKESETDKSSRRKSRNPSARPSGKASRRSRKPSVLTTTGAENYLKDIGNKKILSKRYRQHVKWQNNLQW